MNKYGIIVVVMAVLLLVALAVHLAMGQDYWPIMVLLVVSAMIVPLALIAGRHEEREFKGEDQYHLHP